VSRATTSGRLRRGLLEDLKKISGLTVELTRDERLWDPKTPHLLGDWNASIEIDPRDPDETLCVESLAECIE
jgi:hypothetical protein